MSISQNFPAISPSLSLNFARSKTLDPRITFSRTSTATRVNEQGLIEVMSADEPRFDHKYENGVVKSLGLLVEEQRSNLVTYSDDLSQWIPNGFGIITPNDTVSPDGNTTADKVTQTNHIYSGAVREISGITTNTVYSCSVFIKPDGDTKTRFGFYDTASWQGYLDTDWSSGEPSTVLTNSSDIVYEEYPNGWYRVSFKASTQSDAFAGKVYFHCHPDRTGTGKSAWFWGAQLEAGAFPTSYIPNDTGSQKTRNPDSVSMTGTNFSDWYNQSEGTLYVSASILGKNIHTTGVEYPNGICKISDTESDHKYSKVLYFSGNYDLHRVTFGNRDSVDNVINVYDNTFGDIQSNQYYKVCGAYINNDEQALCLNGRDIKFNGTNVNPPTPNQFLIGTGYNGGIADAPHGDEMYLNGHISQLTYYPRRLTDAQLQNLTK